MKKPILVLYTGGTFGGAKTPRGVAPLPVEKLAPSLPASPHQVQVEEFHRIMDSSAMVPSDWVEIARKIEDRYAQFDGFVILHGTDTMAYTSSALSWLIDGLTKPIVLTGSQVPLCFPNSDASKNYLEAVECAASTDQAGVWVVFGGEILPGRQVVKISCERWRAFGAPKGEGSKEHLGLDSDLDLDLDLDAGVRSFTVQQNIEPDVRLLYCHPGLGVEGLAREILRPAKGLVIASYGVGNLPDDPRIAEALTQAVQSQGKRIIQVSQCAHGGIDPGFYAAGSAMVRAGVEDGGQMTIEAAMTKLMVQLAR